MSVKVAVRVRPFNKREQSLNCECCIDMKDPATILKPHKGEAERVFTFDYSFWSFDEFKEESNGMLVPTGNKYADQTQVFNRIGKNILDNAWEGYHCCLFAYGQTGSGKSYSMIGYGPNKVNLHSFRVSFPLPVTNFSNELKIRRKARNLKSMPPCWRSTMKKSKISPSQLPRESSQD